jgi:predicted phosphodiesterase
MRLQIMSDLHLEHHRDGGKSFIKSLPERLDTVLVLAGDITSLGIRDYAKAHLEPIAEKYKQVVYVPGNHEFYGTTPQEGWFNILSFQFEISNLKVLTSDQPFEFEGKRFIGDTLWFPFDHKNGFYQGMMSDFSIIKRFQPWVYDQHEKTIRDFTKHMREGDIVVTHHMPHLRSVHEQYADSSINRFFVSDQSKLIADKKPSLWIHGHTHEPFDYVEGGTRIVANPLGYPREMKYSDEEFNEDFVIEV